MLLQLNLQSETPIYQQLRDQIIEAIASGALSEGSALPSVRQLAADLEVNMHTVNKAYSILQAEGFVSVHKRAGFIVRSVSEIAATAEHLARLKTALRPTVAEAIARGLLPAKIQQLCAEVVTAVQKQEEVI